MMVHSTMDTCRFLVHGLATIIALASLVSGRAVNISNTWMLPEEGFPVFYRYFRDRISWYEADAVCQFHHANLVTADSTSQYDAIRAYLKELDITENVWIGLSKTAEKPNFTWTDFQPLTGDGHWQEAIPKGNNPLCVAMDPAADFLWRAMVCGGPEVASFICELPVPSWAMGPRGCLLTELPSLTVLYIPEQLALELTSDCGLDGTKRIACKGNADREEILKQLTCAISPDDFDDKSTKAPTVPLQTTTVAVGESDDTTGLNSKTTKPWIWTSNTVDIEYGMPTRHRRETEDTDSPISTKSSMDLSTHQSMSRNKFSTTASSFKLGDSTTPSAPPAPTLSPYPSSSSKSYPATTLDTKAGKSTELKTTQVADLTTQDPNTQTEEQAEASGSLADVVTDQTKATVAATNSGSEDTGEYPSAIGQGQLFSIIENGTMFDIIELNETTSSDADGRLAKDTIGEKPQTASEVLKASTPPPTSAHTNADNMYTTVVYHKEPPAMETTFVTNKSVKKTVEYPKKVLNNNNNNIKNKNVKKASAIDKSINSKEEVYKPPADDDKTLTKEVEMFPITSDSLVRLNRTFRKQLPANEGDEIEEEEDTLDRGSQFGQAKILNFSNNNQLNELPSSEYHQHQHIEIKLHGMNETEKTIFVTTKRIKSSNILRPQEKEPQEERIDPHIDVLNNGSTTIDSESEIFSPTTRQRPAAIPERIIKQSQTPVNPTKSHRDDAEFDGSSSTQQPLSSDDPLEPEPQAQPRPNRQRQLTRPQRRSFYPYFFSRVLG